MASTKFALLIGINYKYSNDTLDWCINDTKTMRNLLKEKGYLEKNITVLRDDEYGSFGFLNTTLNPNLNVLSTYATKKNILNALKQLIIKGNSNITGKNSSSEIFLMYSGRGNFNKNGITCDDIFMIPQNAEEGDYISDADFREIIKNLHKYVKFHIVMDYCNDLGKISFPYVRKFWHYGNLSENEINKHCIEYLNKNIIMISGITDKNREYKKYYDFTKNISEIHMNDIIDLNNTEAGNIIYNFTKVMKNELWDIEKNYMNICEQMAYNNIGTGKYTEIIHLSMTHTNNTNIEQNQETNKIVLFLKKLWIYIKHNFSIYLGRNQSVLINQKY